MDNKLLLLLQHFEQAIAITKISGDKKQQRASLNIIYVTVNLESKLEIFLFFERSSCEATDEANGKEEIGLESWESIYIYIYNHNLC